MSAHGHTSAANKRAAERERKIQQMKLPKATVAFGSTWGLVSPETPPDPLPGPTQAELKSRALVQEAMEIDLQDDEAPPPLYSPAEDDS